MVTSISRLTRKSRSSYPWIRWTDGKARRARQGKDFKCSPLGFAATLYSHAQRHELQVSVSIKEAAVEFQFSKS